MPNVNQNVCNVTLTAMLENLKQLLKSIWFIFLSDYIHNRSSDGISMLTLTYKVLALIELPQCTNLTN